MSTFFRKNHFVCDIYIIIGLSLQYLLTLYPIEMPFDAFANRADPDQAALVRAA